MADATINSNTGGVAADPLLSQLINIIPEILWIGVVLFVIIKFKTPFNQLLSRLGSVKIGDVELQFVSHAFDSIFKYALEVGQWPAIKVKKQDQLLITNRINRVKSRVAGRKVLWVDDHPSNIKTEISLFKQINVDVDCVTSTDEALYEINNDSYDVVISDMARNSDTHAGIKMLEQFKANSINLPVIYYVGNIENIGSPAGAFGITNLPNELFHLFIDAVERSV